MTPNIELLSIGSELLLGQIVDTNSAWISQRLAESRREYLLQDDRWGQLAAHG